MTENAPIVIRPMTEADLETVHAIDRQAFPLPWSLATYRYEMNENALARCWVAEDGGKTIGMLVGWLVVDEFQIGTIAISESHRRRGIGRRLLKTVLESVQKQGAKNVVLEVRKSNTAARSLYEDFGFRIMGERPRFYANGENAYTMMLPDLEKI